MTADATRAVAILGAGLSAALIAACAAAGPSDGSTAEPSFEAILATTHSGVAERRREVVRDEASWARLWSEIHAGFTPAPPLPAVDFSRHMLIAVARPMTPDGPPIIGGTRYANLYLNTGHGTLGWTMACGSGRIMADLLSGRRPDIDISGLGLERYRGGL